MSVRDVLNKWLIGFRLNNIQHKPLSELLQDKVTKKVKTFDDSLATSINRRKFIVERVQSKALELGSVDAAIEWMEELRTRLGKEGKKASLYRLWQTLKQSA